LEEIANFNREIIEIEQTQRYKIEEYDMFMKILSNLADTFDSANYVRKGRLIRILYSNITITKQKRLTLAVKP
jgi:hypothetical protein